MIPVRICYALRCLTLAWLGSGLLVSAGIAGPSDDMRSLRDSQGTNHVPFRVPPDPNFRYVGMDFAGTASAAVPAEANLPQEPPINADAQPGAEKGPMGSAAAPGSRTADLSLLNRIRSAGRLPVIVRLRTASGPSGSLAHGEATLASTQKGVIDRLLSSTDSKREALAIKTFEVTPAVAMHVNEQEFIKLLGYPEVLDVIEDAAAPPGAP